MRDNLMDRDAWYHADRLTEERHRERERATVYAYWCPACKSEVERDSGGRATCTNAACGLVWEARDTRHAIAGGAA
jgi:NAD-dependent DNA ligase